MNSMTGILALTLYALVIYHHLIYPLILKLFARMNKNYQDLTEKEVRGYFNRISDDELPSVSIFIPAYNEENWIAEKIRNVSCLDYPKNKLEVVIVCDGCSDSTAEIARDTIQEAICADTFIRIIEHKENRGKVAIINETVPSLRGDLIALTDVSALLSVDSIYIAADHFNQNEAVGVVNGQYRLLSSPHVGENKYWNYQNTIKLGESRLGALNGAHGAFYVIRKHLFSPLPKDTINDDFIIPMNIIKNGHISIYDKELLALEVEPTSQENDFKRRIRISSGNMQQFIRLLSLINPKRPAIAFTFFSGKVLRLLTPYLLITGYILTSTINDSYFFRVFFIAQSLLFIAFFLFSLFKLEVKNKHITSIKYIVIGHTANLIGSSNYLLNELNRIFNKRGPTL